jgi:hypothetical protein
MVVGMCVHIVISDLAEKYFTFQIPWILGAHSGNIERECEKGDVRGTEELQAVRSAEEMSR